MGARTPPFGPPNPLLIPLTLVLCAFGPPGLRGPLLTPTFRFWYACAAGHKPASAPPACIFFYSSKTPQLRVASNRAVTSRSKEGLKFRQEAEFGSRSRTPPPSVSAKRQPLLYFPLGALRGILSLRPPGENRGGSPPNIPRSPRPPPLFIQVTCCQAHPPARLLL